MKTVFHEYTQRDVGKFVRSTKVLNVWTFTSDRKHEVCLFESLMSGKVKITMDSETLIEKKINDETKKSGIQTTCGDWDLFFVKLGTKWEFRLNFEKFVANKKMDAPAPVLEKRQSEEQSEELGNVLKDLSPAPQRGSPGLSPIDGPRKQKFFASEITNEVMDNDEIIEKDMGTAFTLAGDTKKPNINGVEQFEDTAATKTGNFKKTDKEYVAIDTWGQELPESEELATLDKRGATAETSEIKNAPSNDVSLNGFSKPAVRKNPFIESKEDLPPVAQPKTAAPAPKNIWNAFSAKQPSISKQGGSANPGLVEKPTLLNNNVNPDFLSQPSSDEGINIEIDLARTASFVREAPKPAPAPQTSMNNSKLGPIKGPLKINLQKKPEETFSFNWKGATPDAAAVKNKNHFQTQPINTAKGQNNNRSMFVPKPEATHQTIPAQPFDYFGDFQDKPASQTAQQPQQGRPSWQSNPQPNGQKTVQSTKFQNFGNSNGRNSFAWPTDGGRQSLQISSERNPVWTQNRQSVANQRSPAPAPQKLDRASILREARKVDDDQFLNF